MLPRLIGQGRASELLFSGRSMNAEEGASWGFFNQMHDGENLLEQMKESANKLIAGPNFAHSMTKTMLNQVWNMSLDQAIEAEAQAQAICMQHPDFKEANAAWLAKRDPEWK